MSERLLEALREEAELTTRVPTFDLIAAAGRARRRRRHAVVGAVAACVLGAGGFFAHADAGSTELQPTQDQDASYAIPWPGPTMTTLREGTYEIPFSVRVGSPEAQLTLPPGWNAWLGPNRFEGLGRRVTHDGRVNERILARDPDWYVGLLLLEVTWVAQPGCHAADVTDSDTSGLVRALTDIPGMEVVDPPTSSSHSGRDAVHLRLRQDGNGPACSQDFLFQAPPGPVGFVGNGAVYDAWVIDVDGRPLLAWAAWTRGAPPAEVEALLGIVDTVELHDHTYPTGISP